MQVRRDFSAQLPQEVRHQWCHFGEKVKIKPNVLDKISQTTSSKGDRLSLVLDQWIRNSQEKPTWTDLVGVLKEMNLYQLAGDIELQKIKKKGE